MDLYKNNIYFEKYSDIYVKEFFMYIHLKSIKNNIFPTIEIYEILKNLPYELKILNTNLNENINLENENFVIEGQQNLIKYMKEIFYHNCISDIIKKINIRIYYNQYNFILRIYNNESIDNLKYEIQKYIFDNYSIQIIFERMILKYNHLILENKNMDFYNIKENGSINLLINFNKN